MDMKTDIVAPVPAQVSPESKVSSTAGKPAEAVGETGRTASADIAAVKEVLREALKIEPVEGRELRIEFEKEIKQIVVKVLDSETGELVRQIPMPEEIAITRGLRAAIRKMAGDQSGIAVDREV